MKQKISILIFALFLVLSFGSVEQVLACSCLWESPCQKYDSADLIFVGKVVEIQKEAENAYSVYVKVSEAFKGVKFGDKAKVLSMQNAYGSCGYKFDMNTEYLVFAQNRNSNTGVKGFWSAQCSGNRKIEKSAGETLDDTLEILRRLNEVDESSIVGRIQGFSKNSKRLESLKDIKIKAERIGKGKQIFFGTTNYYGEYFIKVPIGRYLVTPILSDDFIFGERNSKINRILRVRNQTCNSKDFVIVNQAK